MQKRTDQVRVLGRFVGEVVIEPCRHTFEVTARIIHTGPRSIHASVQVTTTDTVGGRPCLVAHGLIVVVSLDERGAARPLPNWEPASDEDHRLDQHARQLIELRQFVEPLPPSVF
jgi:acyl-CoA hydrolase